MAVALILTTGIEIKKLKMKSILSKIILSSISISIPFLEACNATKTKKGAAIGAGGGAVIGGLIGRAADNTAAGAVNPSQ